ncbi:MAG: hypothetical protein HYY06_09620 [Deltaproteobacteria bacterium]|nr:hypothetical protein [Deltaproteobacteria bacterium]
MRLSISVLALVCVQSTAGADPDPLASWRSALARACDGRGQARIALFGDSHVASDGLGGALRDILQRRCGDAGPGFVIPVAPTTFYAHRRVALDARGPWRRLRVDPRRPAPGAYGLGGAAVEPVDRRSAARIVTGAIDALEVWALARPGGGTLEVRIDRQPVRSIVTSAAAEAPLFAGVPIAPGPHSIVLGARGDGPVRIFGLALDRTGPGVIVDALGLDGARASSLVLWREDLLRAHLRRRAHDLVVLAYGTNEVASGRPPARELESDLTEVVARLRRLQPDASCLLVGPTDLPSASPRRSRTVIEIQSRVARAAGCAYFDSTAAQGGPGATARWAAATPPLVGPDLVHMTDEGYAFLARELARAIGVSLTP